LLLVIVRWFYLFFLGEFQAQGHQTDIRSSFDDSATPLLQDDHESGFGPAGAQFDLE
jgi:hypothetical protein